MKLNKKIKTILPLAVVMGAFALSTSVNAALSYTFDTDLEGWSNRVWDTSANGGSGAWIGLAPDATSWTGTLQPADADNGLFSSVLQGGNNYAVSNGSLGASNQDTRKNTQWLRSQAFTLDVGGGDLTFDMNRGAGSGTLPATDAGTGIPFAASATGWNGLALRRVSDGAFVLNVQKTGNSWGFTSYSFTAAQISPYADGTTAYTLDAISAKGTTGWAGLGLDNVVIPGTAAIPEPSSVALLGLGGLALILRRRK